MLLPKMANLFDLLSPTCTKNADSSKTRDRGSVESPAKVKTLSKHFSRNVNHGESKQQQRIGLPASTHLVEKNLTTGRSEDSAALLDVISRELSVSAFTIPKKKEETKGVLANLALTSREWHQELLPAIEMCYLHTSSQSAFSYTQAQTVHNKTLLHRFLDRRKELRQMGYLDKELMDSYAYIHVQSYSQVEKICQEGLFIRNSSVSCLGHPDMGVQLCRYSDVLQQQPMQFGQTGYMVVFKVMKGKLKYVAENKGEVYLEPTPNFDCHVSKTVKTDSGLSNPGQEFLSSQIYLYEYGEDLEVVQSPRHICPIFALSFTYKGVNKDLKQSVHVKAGPSVAPPRPAVRNPIFISQKSRPDDDKGVSVWSGTLSVKGQFPCPVELVSYAGVLKPAQIGRSINIRQKMKTESAKTKFFSNVKVLRKNSDVYSSNKYYSVCDLLPQSTGPQFDKVATYLRKLDSVGLLRLEEDTDLLIFADGPLSEAMGLPKHVEGASHLSCVFIYQKPRRQVLRSKGASSFHRQSLRSGQAAWRQPATSLHGAGPPGLDKPGVSSPILQTGSHRMEQQRPLTSLNNLYRDHTHTPDILKLKQSVWHEVTWSQDTLQDRGDNPKSFKLYNYDWGFKAVCPPESILSKNNVRHLFVEQIIIQCDHDLAKQPSNLTVTNRLYGQQETSIMGNLSNQMPKPSPGSSPITSKSVWKTDEMKVSICSAVAMMTSNQPQDMSPDIKSPDTTYQDSDQKVVASPDSSKSPSESSMEGTVSSTVSDTQKTLLTPELDNITEELAEQIVRGFLKTSPKTPIVDLSKLNPRDPRKRKLLEAKLFQSPSGQSDSGSDSDLVKKRRTGTIKLQETVEQPVKLLRRQTSGDRAISIMSRDSSQATDVHVPASPIVKATISDQQPKVDSRPEVPSKSEQPALSTTTVSESEIVCSALDMKQLLDSGLTEFENESFSDTDMELDMEIDLTDQLQPSSAEPPSMVAPPAAPVRHKKGSSSSKISRSLSVTISNVPKARNIVSADDMKSFLNSKLDGSKLKNSARKTSEKTRLKEKSQKSVTNLSQSTAEDLANDESDSLTQGTSPVYAVGVLEEGSLPLSEIQVDSHTSTSLEKDRSTETCSSDISKDTPEAINIVSASTWLPLSSRFPGSTCSTISWSCLSLGPHHSSSLSVTSNSGRPTHGPGVPSESTRSPIVDGQTTLSTARDTQSDDMPTPLLLFLTNVAQKYNHFVSDYFRQAGLDIGVLFSSAVTKRKISLGILYSDMTMTLRPDRRGENHADGTADTEHCVLRVLHGVKNPAAAEETEPEESLADLLKTVIHTLRTAATIPTRVVHQTTTTVDKCVTMSPQQVEIPGVVVRKQLPEASANSKSLDTESRLSKLQKIDPNQMENLATMPNLGQPVQPIGEKRENFSFSAEGREATLGVLYTTTLTAASPTALSVCDDLPSSLVKMASTKSLPGLANDNSLEIAQVDLLPNTGSIRTNLEQSKSSSDMDKTDKDKKMPSFDKNKTDKDKKTASYSSELESNFYAEVETIRKKAHRRRMKREVVEQSEPINDYGILLLEEKRQSLELPTHEDICNDDAVSDVRDNAGNVCSDKSTALKPKHTPVTVSTNFQSSDNMVSPASPIRKFPIDIPTIENDGTMPKRIPITRSTLQVSADKDLSTATSIVSKTPLGKDKDLGSTSIDSLPGDLLLVASCDLQEKPSPTQEATSMRPMTLEDKRQHPFQRAVLNPVRKLRSAALGSLGELLKNLSKRQLSDEKTKPLTILPTTCSASNSQSDLLDRVSLESHDHSRSVTTQKDSPDSPVRGIVSECELWSPRSSPEVPRFSPHQTRGSVLRIKSPSLEANKDKDSTPGMSGWREKGITQSFSEPSTYKLTKIRSIGSKRDYGIVLTKNLAPGKLEELISTDPRLQRYTRIKREPSRPLEATEATPIIPTQPVTKTSTFKLKQTPSLQLVNSLARHNLLFSRHLSLDSGKSKFRDQAAVKMESGRRSPFEKYLLDVKSSQSVSTPSTEGSPGMTEKETPTVEANSRFKSTFMEVSAEEGASKVEPPVLKVKPQVLRVKPQLTASANSGSHSTRIQIGSLSSATLAKICDDGKGPPVPTTDTLPPESEPLPEMSQTDGSNFSQKSGRWDSRDTIVYSDSSEGKAFVQPTCVEKTADADSLKTTQATEFSSHSDYSSLPGHNHGNNNNDCEMENRNDYLKFCIPKRSSSDGDFRENVDSMGTSLNWNMVADRSTKSIGDGLNYDNSSMSATETISSKGKCELVTKDVCPMLEQKKQPSDSRERNLDPSSELYDPFALDSPSSVASGNSPGTKINEAMTEPSPHTAARVLFERVEKCPCLSQKSRLLAHSDAANVRVESPLWRSASVDSANREVELTRKSSELQDSLPYKEFMSEHLAWHQESLVIFPGKETTCSVQKPCHALGAHVTGTSAAVPDFRTSTVMNASDSTTFKHNGLEDPLQGCDSAQIPIAVEGSVSEEDPVFHVERRNSAPACLEKLFGTVASPFVSGSFLSHPSGVEPSQIEIGQINVQTGRMQQPSIDERLFGRAGQQAKLSETHKDNARVDDTLTARNNLDSQLGNALLNFYKDIGPLIVDSVENNDLNVNTDNEAGSSVSVHPHSSRVEDCLTKGNPSLYFTVGNENKLFQDTTAQHSCSCSSKDSNNRPRSGSLTNIIPHHASVHVGLPQGGASKKLPFTRWDSDVNKPVCKVKGWEWDGKPASGTANRYPSLAFTRNKPPDNDSQARCPEEELKEKTVAAALLAFRKQMQAVMDSIPALNDGSQKSSTVSSIYEKSLQNFEQQMNTFLLSINPGMSDSQYGNNQELIKNKNLGNSDRSPGTIHFALSPTVDNLAKTGGCRSLAGKTISNSMHPFVSEAVKTFEKNSSSLHQGIEEDGMRVKTMVENPVVTTRAVKMENPVVSMAVNIVEEAVSARRVMVENPVALSLSPGGILVPEANFLEDIHPGDLKRVFNYLASLKEGGVSWSMKVHSLQVCKLAAKRNKQIENNQNGQQFDEMLKLLTIFRKVGIVELLPHHICDKQAGWGAQELIKCACRLQAEYCSVLGQRALILTGKAIAGSRLESVCRQAELRIMDSASLLRLLNK